MAKDNQLDKEMHRVLSNPDGKVIMSESLSKLFGESASALDFLKVIILDSDNNLNLNGKFIQLKRAEKSLTQVTVRMHYKKIISALSNIVLGSNLKVNIEDYEFFGEIIEYSIQILDSDQELIDFCFSIK